jgi:thiocyanate hydrolase gamma subunit
MSTPHSHEGHEHAHDHGHGHPHEHPKAPTVDEITDFEVLEIAVRELAIEHGLFTAEEHRQFTEWAESIGPIGGSRLVAKAWVDPEFKARVRKDAVAACKEIGIDWAEPTGFGTPSDYTHLYVLENTPTLHHVIVCTLCSCYPRPLLGMSPEWYRTTNYRRRVVRWPRQVLAEFGLIVPEDVEVRVEDSNQKCRFMVMPMRPEGTEGWTEEQLTEIVTRDTMIGVALPKPGRTADVHPVRKARRPVQTAAAHEEAAK